MTDRERLIDLIREAKKHTKNANSDLERNMIFADYLLEHGVIVPPCKVGDTVYSIDKKVLAYHWDEHMYIVDKWSEYKVCEIPFSLTLWEHGWKDIFLTREEAEKALREREKEWTEQKK